MIDSPHDAQWWIAREGQRHGPLSESEMRAFVEMRHLKPTDLVWREGFADWTPAQQAFPMDGKGAAPQTAASGHSRDEQDESAPVQNAAETAATANRAAERQAPPSFPVGKLIGVGAALSAVVVMAWVIAENYPAIAGALGFKGQSSTATAAFREGESTVSLDARLQKIPLWNTIKKEFPNWYGDLMREAVKLSADDPQGAAMAKHIAEAIVALRRQNADSALAAGPSRLRDIAEAFLKNLQALKAQSTTACYAFISQGETSPATVALLEKPGDGRPLQNHVEAIVAAISEGRASPVKREKPSKADYDTLAASLMKLGWSDKDLKLFADPRALASATPEKVCQMVQDWFSAHISISDEAMRERLLVETLRPVVAG